jgi:penicillin-binding protein 2
MGNQQEDKDGKSKSILKRLNLMFVFIFTIFALLIFRLAVVQLIEGEKYLLTSQRNSTKTLTISAPRGMIFDRHGQSLVWNKPVFTVTYLEADRSTDEEKLAEELSGILGMEPTEILGAMNTPQPSYLTRRIKVDISKEQMFKLVERRTELPGIDVMVESVREILGTENDPTGTHIFGYVNSISSSQVKEYMSKGYRPTDRIGVTGLEKEYEQQLRGVDGHYEIKVNKNAETIERVQGIPPVPGNDLILTIDWQFQRKVEQILKAEVERIRVDNPAVEEAIALAMNPQTGEILALANYPNYDLNYHYSNNFGKIYNEKIRGRELNKIINSAYPVGSTIKPLSELIGFHEGLVSPAEHIFCGGSLKVGDRTIYCWKRTGHGSIDARQALQYSCNVYMYELAMRLAEYPSKPKEFQSKFAVLDYYFQQMGLGIKTGIDLPGESTGWKTNTFFLGNLAYAMIGQYNAYTPIQLLQYISVIANDGYRVEPKLVKEIRSSYLSKVIPGKILLRKEVQALNRVDFSTASLQVVQEGMKKVSEPGGTAYGTYADFPIPIAIKTGTAQTGGSTDNSLIAGYAPFEDPEIAFVVIVPKGGSGSETTGPISRKMLEAYFQLEQPPAEAGK